MINLKPRDLGIKNNKFKAFRPVQKDIISRGIEVGAGLKAFCAPTGSGKTLAYVALGILRGEKTVILTSTKGLQDQLKADFGDLVYILKGKSNYKCVLNRLCDCSNAPCVWSGGMERCRLYRDCKFVAALGEAKRSQIVVTNYAFWLANGENLDKIFGQIDLLICDEAHEIVKTILDAQSIVLPKKQLEKLKIEAWLEQTTCNNNIRDYLKKLEGELKIKKGGLSPGSPTGNQVLRLLNDLQKIASIPISDRVLEWKDNTIMVDELWPVFRVNDLLFCGIKNVLLISATIRPKILQVLGIEDRTEYREYQSDFNFDLMPIYYVPGVRVDYRWTKQQQVEWVKLIDNIIRGRMDRKGIIHTISYKRRGLLLEHSEFRKIMITHESFNTQYMVKKFRESKNPLILVSPSLMTGWDFPYSDCEYQVISKIGFPDLRKKVDKMRAELDKEYSMYVAMNTIDQAIGRGMRAKDDQCENFIIDRHFRDWFWGRYKNFATENLRRIKFKNAIPGPLPKLDG